MMDGASSRVPLQEIPQTLRRSGRIANDVTLKNQSQSQQAQKHGKVISSKKQTLQRRRKTAAGTNKRATRRTVKKEPAVAVTSLPEEPKHIPPSLVSVRAEDEWLCQPSVAHEMYLHAKRMERRHCFSPDYLKKTGSRVTNDMRATLVNWLVEIHGHLKLEPEVLHTAVRLLDAALQHFKVGVTRLQLCGLAVFWLATKLESRPLNAQDLLYLMCYKGDVSILVRMEQTVLKLLNFEMQVADPVFFLSRLMLYDENGKSEEFFNTCNYCMDAILHDISVVEIPASKLASGALLAARIIDGRWDWPKPIGYATECWPTSAPLQPLALQMIRTILEGSDGTSNYSGAFKKYASRKRYYGLSESPKFSSVNLIPLIQILSNSTVVDMV